MNKLERVDYDAIDALLFLNGAVIDESCALDLFADVTKVCTVFLDTVSNMGTKNP